MLKRLFPLALVALLGACTQSPYFPGRTPSDVPSHVDVVYLKNIYITTWGGENVSDPKSEPNRDMTPSDNDKEVLALAKANILSQMQNFGYSVTEDETKAADAVMGFYVAYQPERWPLVDRSVGISGKLYALDGTPLFKMYVGRVNSIGLIGALAGPSRDDMVSDAAREVAVKVVTEMRKGTKDNKPVAAQPVAAAAAGVEGK